MDDVKNIAGTYEERREHRAKIRYKETWENTGWKRSRKARDEEKIRK